MSLQSSFPSIRIFACIFCFAIISNSYGQVVQKRIMGSFIIQNRAYFYEVLQHDNRFHFKIARSYSQLTAPANEKDDNDAAQTADESELSGMYSFILPSLDQEAFKSEINSDASFLKSIRNGINTTQKAKFDKEFDNLSLSLFYEIKAKLETVDDQPVTAYMVLKKKSIESYLVSNNSAYYNGRFSALAMEHYIDKVSIEIADGAIKNIKVSVFSPRQNQGRVAEPAKSQNIPDSGRKNVPDTSKSGGHNRKVQEELERFAFTEFKNQFPISISGKFDPQRFADIKLYSVNTNGEYGIIRFIRLSSILHYDILFANDKEDYSPENCEFILDSSNVIVRMKKEKRSKILSVAAFSDFVGIDQEEPNGLVQIEAFRKINVNTKYSPFLFRSGAGDIISQLPWGKYSIHRIVSSPQSRKGRILDSRRGRKRGRYFAMFDTSRSQGKYDVPDEVRKEDFKKYKDSIHFAGWFRATRPNRPYTYINLLGSVEPRLLFSKIEQNNRFLDSATIVDGNVDPLSLFKYQLASFGLKVNLLKLSFPQLKCHWNVLEAGAYWFRTRIGDASDTLKASVPINSHYLSFASNIVFNPDNRWGVSFGAAYMRPEIWHPDYRVSSTDGLAQIQFDAHYSTNEDSKLFFRFRWTRELKVKEENFTQVQLGYTLSLFGK